MELSVQEIWTVVLISLIGLWSMYFAFRQRTPLDSKIGTSFKTDHGHSYCLVLRNQEAIVEGLIRSLMLRRKPIVPRQPLRILLLPSQDQTEAILARLSREYSEIVVDMAENDLQVESSVVRLLEPTSIWEALSVINQGSCLN